MRVIQFDSKYQSHSLKNIGHLIRYGYVLSNYLGSIGLSTSMIIIEFLFDGKNLIEQVNLLRQIPRLKDDFEIIDYFLEAAKLFKKIKRPDKDDIINYRQAEASAKKFVKMWMDLKIKYQHDCGMGSIIKLHLDYTYDFFHSAAKPEEVQNTRYLYTVDLLANKSTQEHVNNNIWLFPPDFINEEIASFIIDNPNADSIPNHYLVEACTLPTLFSYTNQELKATAKMFASKCHQFQEACEEWTKQCYAGGGRSYFTESIYSLLPSLQPAFNDDALVNYKRNIDEDKTTHTLFIGEVSPIHIWKYYKELENEVEKEIELLINNYLENGIEYTFPVFIFRQSTNASIDSKSTSENVKIEDTDKPFTENETELLGLKKHFNIDDM